MHVHHETSSTHSVLDLLEMKRKGEDEDETFGNQSPVPLGRSIPGVHQPKSAGIRFLELTYSRQSHNTKWLHWKHSSHGETSNLFVPGWPFTSAHTQV